VGVLAIGLTVGGAALARRTFELPNPMLASAVTGTETTTPPVVRAGPPPTAPAQTTPSPPPTDADVPQATPTLTRNDASADRRSRGGVFVTGERKIATAIAAALRNGRCPMATSAAAAAVVIRVSWNVDLRPAPFGTGAAVTADYAATVNVQDGQRVRRSLDFDGHVMEVGESVTLAAARRDLASRVAETLAPTLSCRP
jgi:hypothetical protein